MNPAEQIASGFRFLRNIDEDQLCEAGKRIAIPLFEPPLVISLIEQAIPLMAALPTLVKIEPPVVIFGDIHGSLLDLLRALQKAGSVRDATFLFLGDYVDRGEFSLECILLLVSLFVQNPKNVVLLRGNHEFENTNTVYGFRAEMLRIYGDEIIYHKINSLFSYLPIAALIGKETFCVHGGISPDLYNIDQINSIVRPIKDDEDNLLVKHLVWADPSTEFVHYSESRRGKGITFGVTALEEFMSYTNIKRIVRGHQCVDGIKTCLNSICVTVFTSSNYKIGTNNKSAILRIENDYQFVPIVMNPLEKISRNSSKFNRIPNTYRSCPFCISTSSNKKQSFLTDPSTQKSPHKPTSAELRIPVAKLLIPQTSKDLFEL